MKEFIGWTVWTWRNWELWQKLFIAGMLLQIIGWFVPGTAGLFVSGLGLGIIFGHILKWFVWDSAKASWEKYKQHRNELLTTIKDSDK